MNSSIDSTDAHTSAYSTGYNTGIWAHDAERLDEVGRADDAGAQIGGQRCDAVGARLRENHCNRDVTSSPIVRRPAAMQQPRGTAEPPLYSSTDRPKRRRALRETP